MAPCSEDILSGLPSSLALPSVRQSQNPGSDRHHQYQNISIIPQSNTNIHWDWQRQTIVIMDENMHLYLEQLAREAFKEFDKDNSGTIDQKVDSSFFYFDK